MRIKIKNWYCALSNISQVIVLFFVWFAYWFLISYLTEKVWPADNPKSLQYQVINGLLDGYSFFGHFQLEKIKAAIQKKEYEQYLIIFRK